MRVEDVFFPCDDHAYIVVYTWVGRLFWLQSSRNHVLSNSTNVGDIVGIQMIALWQTAHKQLSMHLRFRIKEDWKIERWQFSKQFLLRLNLWFPLSFLWIYFIRFRFASIAFRRKTSMILFLKVQNHSCVYFIGMRFPSFIQTETWLK